MRSAMTSARNRLNIDSAMTIRSCVRSTAVGNEPASRMVAEIAPGPAINGRARGNTAMLWI
ncbi:hypothetical protein D3C71_2203070 [compost metagenome]